jgi:membrane-bound serine protease (ClpP class)
MVPVLVGATAIEVAETFFWVWLSGRRRTPAGTAALVGLQGSVVQACRPVGLVQLRGEMWRARCDRGAADGERVVVRGARGLELLVEPAPAAGSDG